MISLAALIAVTYLAFVFFAEMSNPFVKPRGHILRTQWRYGRKMAIAVLIGGGSALALLNMTELAGHVAVGIGAIIGSVLALLFSLDKILRVLRR